MDNNFGDIEIERAVTEIENKINSLNQLNLHILENNKLTVTCSKLINLSERLNSLAYSSLYALGESNGAEMSCLSILGQINNKED